MEQSRSAYNRRAFLKSSFLAGGGLMISFSVFPELGLAEKTKGVNLPAEWSEITGYIKITPDNIIKII